MEVPKRRVVLALYKELIYYSKLLPNKTQSQDNLKLIKTTFRKNKDIPENSEQINKLLEDGQKKLSFLKIMTPRQYSKTYNISGTYKFEDGKWIGGNEEKKTKRIYKDHGIDIMDLRRHNHLLRRMNFMDR
ncbi:hypothetical protein DICPUDRAFT_83708 [Dictyostelium purpureum]|uniref:Complex 1 LYR protein domain-containing protein n=1 Tax=Dictyostelium purpureum TaxID=5786 RepID=F1A0D2_DICPU|nr:uncharacterized protein DICPUDRAFT_83708 [Dictyostelium purpureum]EGC30351.1 hypothetical protein DICPUDRAFT_83708 [Dictyostelium purpureum]|eukprot:XP_003293121.1 hypothetical protein DICPUDRAFT_83708 [Dictyostelium purpureum]